MQNVSLASANIVHHSTRHCWHKGGAALQARILEMVLRNKGQICRKLLSSFYPCEMIR